MSYTVVWSAEAEATYADLLTFLEERWSETQVLRFIESEQLIDLIERNPFMYPYSKSKDIRRAVVSKQTSLYYYVIGQVVVLLSFEDNRQDPNSIVY